MAVDVKFGIHKQFSSAANYTSPKAKLKARRRILPFLLVASIFINVFNALAISDPGAQLEQAGITTKLGNALDVDISLIDSSGNSRTISELLSDGKPLILIPVYYKCPRLCGLLLGGVTQLIKDLDLKLGTDFKVAAFSFSAGEDFSLAAQKKKHYSTVLAESGRSIEGWEFFVGEADQTKALIDQLGFRIMPDGEDFAHSAAIFIVNKNGLISQFFTNIDFPSADVRLALVETSQGKIGNLLDQALLFCFRFDPTKGKYTWAVGRLMQLVGVLSLLVVGGTIVWAGNFRLFRRQRK